MPIKPALGVALAAALLGTACSDKSATTAPSISEQSADNTGGVVRTEVPAPTPTPTPAPAPTPAAIQVQPGPAGSQVSLTRVAVTGDILTVSLAYARPGMTDAAYDHPKLNEVSVIDDATSQRIGVLKDNNGQWLAAPLGTAGTLDLQLKQTPQIVWFKFPAPPPTTKTVSINIPNVAPFDGVPIAR